MSEKSQTNKGNVVFEADVISARLTTELPEWRYKDGYIQRKYLTSGWKSTLMLINAIGHLSELAWHHPDIEASYGFVVVKLMNHEANGITEKDFELAARIEQVILWRPELDAESTLTGTPDDPRFRYIKYD